MDTWKFYDITHRDHVVCNPTSLERLDELIELLDLAPGSRVLDIGSGKGEFLIRTAEYYGGEAGRGFRATAIDISPYVVAELSEKALRRVPGASIEIREMDAAEYSAEPEAFDLTCCLGASWVYGGYKGTLEALSAATRPGGQILVGEPFWRREPDAAYLDSSGMNRENFGSHPDNVVAGVTLGLIPLLAWPSSDQEWDRYETLQWRAAAQYAAAHPDDEDVPTLLKRVERSRHEYLTWARDTLGWALYLFAKPA